MDFFVWHYTLGIDFYLSRWIFYVRWMLHYFSLSLLIQTLFSPWKRLVEVDKSPGFNLQRYFQTMMFNLISRGIGAVVRFSLFWVGVIGLIIVFFGGAFGVILWILLPFLGVFQYLKYTKRPQQFVDDLKFDIKKSNEPAIKVLLDTQAGEFLLAHTGLEKDDLIENSKDVSGIIESSKHEGFKDIISDFVKKKVWREDYLKKKGLTGKDMELVAAWWDGMRREASGISQQDFLSRPGVGLELLYGYTPTLNQYSVDLSLPQDFSHRLIGRQQVVSQMERALTSGNSVVLVGQPGVGKKTVVLEFAHRAVQGRLGPKMAYRRILELDYNSLLSASIDVNQKKTQLSQILAEAAYAGNVILMIRDIQRLTNSEVEGYDFTDVFEEYMEGKELKIIAVSIPSDYERFISPNMRLRKHLKEVEVVPPTKEEAMEILVEAARNWEYKKNITIQIPALRNILEGSDKFITEVPFPEKALELLDAVVYFCDQEGKTVASTDEAEKVLAEKTGVPLARLTESEKKKLSRLEEIIHERLVDQEAAVDLIAKSLRGRTAGVKGEDRPIGTFLFLGPTGVGKTETAKVLARVYYGNEEKILRFDMAEYAGKEGLERLIGSVSDNLPGRLTTAIKNDPASLLLLDEFEKASPAIYNLFLPLLDEGEITDAFGKKINCRHLFVVATSNAAAEKIRQLITEGVKGDELQKTVVNFVLEQGLFTPEFINRFDGVVVYEPLGKAELVKIARLMFDDLKKEMEKKNIYLSAGEDVITKLAEEGFEPAFGARPMRRIIDLVLGDLIGKAILSGDISSGSRIKITAGSEKDQYSWEKVD